MIHRTRKLISVTILLSLLIAPGTSSPQATSSSQEASLKNFLQKTFKTSSSDSGTKYLSAFVNLNGDGRQEAIVYLLGPNSCGSGGCNLFVLAPAERSFKVITEMTITRTPIRVLTTKTNGWYDLSVHVQGGGIQPGYDAKLSFNGKKYPSNPSVPPAHKLRENPAGKSVITSLEHATSFYP
jgi:hypothetical protein